jgi:C4-dicarboxylate-specific signal transduction histidine kinase
MRKKLITTVMIAAFLFALHTAGAEQMSGNTMGLGGAGLTGFGTDPLVVQAVKKENAKAKALDTIKTLDAKWAKSEGMAELMNAVLKSETADYLNDIQKKAAYFAEIFLMDNQGALVAATNKTAEYWKGDDVCFKQPFSTGTVHVSEVAFVPAAQAYLVRISVPVKDGDETIGALTFGIDLNKFD